MYSKNEFKGSRIPKVTIEVGAMVLTKDIQGTGTQGMRDQQSSQQLEPTANQEQDYVTRVQDWENEARATRDPMEDTKL